MTILRKSPTAIIGVAAATRVAIPIVNSSEVVDAQADNLERERRQGGQNGEGGHGQSPNGLQANTVND